MIFISPRTELCVVRTFSETARWIVFLRTKKTLKCQPEGETVKLCGIYGGRTTTTSVIYPSFQILEKTGRLPGQKDQGFTTVGKPKMASKQYNSPMKMYSEDIIEEIMTQGTAFGKEIDPSNPWNMTGKQFDAAKSGVLAAIMTDDTKINNNHQIA